VIQSDASKTIEGFVFIAKHPAGYSAIRSGPSRTDFPKTCVSNWVLCGRVAPDEPVIRVVLTGEVFPIGRHDQNRLCLPNQTVSGRHAELVCLPEGLVLVRDLLSTNGTFLNGQRVEGSQLAGPGDVLQFGSAIFHLESADSSTNPLTEKRDVGDDCVGRMQFSKLFQSTALRPVFQPIVRLDDLSRVGFEVLARSHLVGLETPEAMFKVAAERNAEIELSRLIRNVSLHLASRLPPAEEIYLNTHPAELSKPDFLETIQELRQTFPHQKMVLEIHEAAVTDLDWLRRIRETLLELDMGLSYDDFGAGQARLLELGEVPPDVLKFDMQLIHDLPNATRERQRLVECLVKVTREMGILALAECLETEEELELCRQLGFDLAQGFHLGHPAPVEQWID
jgi:EAL domain-containing protein (putative c-di-GMP-specific phosphodiesterase class I)